MTIHIGRIASTNGQQAPCARAMMRTCRKKVQELASAAWRAALRGGTTRKYEEDWIQTGAAYKQGAHEVKVHALRCAAPRVERSGQEKPVHVELYCDGAWDPESGNMDAGAAAAEFDLRAPQRDPSDGTLMQTTIGTHCNSRK